MVGAPLAMADRRHWQANALKRDVPRLATEDYGRTLAIERESTRLNKNIDRGHMIRKLQIYRALGRRQVPRSSASEAEGYWFEPSRGYFSYL